MRETKIYLERFYSTLKKKREKVLKKKKISWNDIIEGIKDSLLEKGNRIDGERKVKEK